MTVKPIIFSGPMVRALLDGRKTQTRRVLNPQPRRDARRAELYGPSESRQVTFYANSGYPLDSTEVPYAVGDVLYVREAWRSWLGWDHRPPGWLEPGRHSIRYEADRYGPEGIDYGKLRPSIHLPKKFSRLCMEVTRVRVERVQDISDNDAAAEGIRYAHGSYELEWMTPTARGITRIEDFSDLWDSINAKRGYGWDANPWVAVVEWEKVIHQNVDEYLSAVVFNEKEEAA